MEELFLWDEPCTTQRPEVTPAMIGIEVRRSITAIWQWREIFIVIAILCTAEETFRVVFRRGRSSNGTGRYGSTQLDNAVEEHVIVVAGQRRYAAMIVFMPEHSLCIMFSERMVPVKQLLIVIRPSASMINLSYTIGTCKLSEPRVDCMIRAGFV